MEGGSPSLIWERWTLPMYCAQRRYWSDHPRVDELVAAYLGVKSKKTPPPGAKPRSKLDWSLLSPVPEERAIIPPHGTPPADPAKTG
jgi:hypothetical protein